MKLIVLKGNPQTGKTTILKMVYEMLKKINVEETHCFKYYDSDHDYNDFRDVLVIDKEQILSVEDVMSDGNNDKPVNINCVEHLKHFFPTYEVINSSNEELEKSIQILEKCNKDKNEFQQSPKYEDVLPIECLNKLQNISQKYLKIGFVLEGDYGFLHRKSQWAKHPRNLYRQLKQMMVCDIIICACSNTPYGWRYDPYYCLFCFIEYCVLKSIPVQLVVLETENKDDPEKIKNANTVLLKKIIYRIKN